MPIAICEPQVTGFGHEAINSAFIQGVRIAFPDEKIILFADRSHIEVIKRIFVINNIEINNIEYHPIAIPKLKYFTFQATRSLISLFNELICKVKSLGIKRIFFLSISSDGLYALKLIGEKSIKYSMVLHGVFEWITKGPYNPYRSLIHRMAFNFKRAIKWRHTSNYRYLALSPHILNEAKNHIDIDKYNIASIFLPFVFSKENINPGDNEFIRFATIGKGSPSRIEYIVTALNKKDTDKFEIKIISKAVGNLEGIANVNCVSPGKRLTRDEIEEHIKDVDILLMLYNQDAYKLSCSGALFEAFAYLKPVIFLNNPCVDYYHSLEKIGYACEDLDEVIQKMEEIITNFHHAAIKDELDFFRNNILSLRAKIDIKNNVEALKEIL